jgi:hypothetical protein
VAKHEPIEDENFARFWAAYPRRKARLDALKAWNRLDPSLELVERILTALEWQREQDQWCRDDGNFIPYPATWLRAGSYDDEPVTLRRVVSTNPRTAGNAAAIARFIARGKA